MTLLAQAQPQTGPTFSIDWNQLVPNIVGLFFQAIGTWLQKALSDTFDGFWAANANVLTHTDMGMTWDLGPIAAQVDSVQSASRAVLIFALMLLGIRGALGAIVPEQPDMRVEAVNGILGAVVLTTAFPIVIPDVMEWINMAADSVARGTDLTGYFRNDSGVADPLIKAVLLVVLLFFVLRLLIKAIWRIGFLAVLLPLGAAAMMLHAIPQTRWIKGWWARVWGGMLVAQIPSTLALVIGLQLLRHAGGIGAFVYSIAFLQLAHDLYDLIPHGMARSQSSPVAGAAQNALVLAGGALGAGAAIGGAASGAVGGAASAGSIVSPALAAGGRPGLPYGY